jgi:hypothetical protein
MSYTPDKWAILEILPKDRPPIYKAFGGWAGSYIDSDSWRINSGIKSVVDKDVEYILKGYSGSIYECNKGRYGLTGLMCDVLHSFQTQEHGIRLLAKEEAWEVLKTITTTP